MDTEKRPLDTRRVAALAHASIFVNVVALAVLGLLSGADVQPASGGGVTAILTIFAFLPAVGPVVAFVIWRSNRSKEEWVAFHGLQATLFQIPLLAILWFVPWGQLLGLMGLVYAAWATIQCLRGADFKYALIGNFAAGMIERRRGRP